MGIPFRSHLGTENCSLPPATKLGQGYVFTRVCDSVHGGGVVVSQHALQVVSQHALQVVSQHALQVVSQHALQVSGGGSQGPHPGVKLRGLVRGVSRPTPRGGVGGLQAHTWGVSRPTPGGGCVCIPACTKAEPSPPRGRLLPQAVRILLECILVYFACLWFRVAPLANDPSPPKVNQTSLKIH